MKDELILGSGSERRRGLLRELGARFSVVVPGAREVFYPTDARRTALENCRKKMRWCRRKLPGRRIITADTVVRFRGRCVPKPSSLDEAAGFLRQFSGRKHDVFTAVAMFAPGRGVTVRVARSSVTFKRLSDRAIARYFREVDPMDKAGAYNIDQASHLIIRSFSGSYSNIVGLPVEIVSKWLCAAAQARGEKKPWKCLKR